MSDTMASEALVLKIRKLLALANHNPSEAEAAAAAAKVQQLVAQHNISLHMLETDDPVRLVGGGKRERKVHDRSALYTWQRELMAGIAGVNMCRHWVREVEVPHERKAGATRFSKRHMLLGREVNVVASTLLYDYLCDTMDRLLPFRGMELRGKQAGLWLAGCSDRLVQRLKAQRAKEIAEAEAAKQRNGTTSRHPSVRENGAAPGTALVLVDVLQSEDDLNEDAIYGYEPGTTARRRAAREAENAVRRAKIKELQGQGMNWEDAWYVAYYGEVPDSVLAARAAAADETPEQRKAREARAERMHQRASEKYWREQARQSSKRTSDEYRMGAQAGDGISLSRQIDEDQTSRLK